MLPRPFRSSRSAGAVPLADGPPLVATADDALLEAAVRWCAAAGATPDVAHDEYAIRRAWRSASAVLMGQDFAWLDVPRRERVLLISHGEAWAEAVHVGAAAVAVVGEEEPAVEAVLGVLDGHAEGCLVSVVPAVGGAGASTLACFLARAAVRRGLSTALVDVDAAAGGLDVMLGAERSDGARWSDLADVSGPMGAATLPRVLPRVDGMAVLAPGASLDLPDDIGAVADSAVRGFDVVVADVPRGLRGPAADDLVARSLLAVVVVPERVHAIAAARRVVAEVHRRCATVVAVTVRSGGGTGPAAVGDLLGIPVVGRVAHERRIGQGVEAGRGPGASRRWTTAAAAVLDLLGLEQTASVDPAARP